MPKDVFDAWREEFRLARWWGQADFTNLVCMIEPKAGGAIRIDMHGPDATLYPVTGVVRASLRRFDSYSRAARMRMSQGKLASSDLCSR